MNRFGLVIVSALLASTFLVDVQAKQAFFEFENDPHYPQLVHVSNVQYQLVNDNSIEFSAAVTIYEELNDGTNVSNLQNFRRKKHLKNLISFPL